VREIQLLQLHDCAGKLREKHFAAAAVLANNDADDEYLRCKRKHQSH